CANAVGTVTCTSSGLGNGANESFTITAHIGSGYADEIGRATAGKGESSRSAHSDSANKSTSWHTTVSRDAVMQIEETAPATPTAGNNLTYTLKVTNIGPSYNAGYTPNDVPAARNSFRAASSGCANAVGTVTCTSSGLGNGANESFTITAHIGSGYADGGDLAQTSTRLNSRHAESAPANNSST